MIRLFEILSRIYNRIYTYSNVLFLSIHVKSS